MSFSRAPRDCVQYYTGAAGNLQSFGHAGSQLLQGMDYEICIRYFLFCLEFSVEDDVDNWFIEQNQILKILIQFIWCIVKIDFLQRDEKGYCGISYIEASGQTIDTFSILSPPIAPAPSANAVSVTGMFILYITF